MNVIDTNRLNGERLTLASSGLIPKNDASNRLTSSIRKWPPVLFIYWKSTQSITRNVLERTQPGRAASGCQKPSKLNLLFGTSVHASRPSQHIFHSFCGLVASPGPRNAIPMTAIGRIGAKRLSASDCMLASRALSFRRVLHAI